MMALVELLQAHWLSDEQVVLVDSTVSKRTVEESTVHFDQVVVQLSCRPSCLLVSSVVT
jgi:hypothetical protein